MLNLMYITNDPIIAKIAEANGVDYILVDMEYIGKAERQFGMDTVLLHHTVEDVKNVRGALSSSRLMVRVNPIHEADQDYGSSEEEINAVIAAGADAIMLPYFKTVDEVRTFLRLVNGRAESVLLLETPEAANVLEDILALGGIDFVHIGLNDMSIGMHRPFLFQLLADGTVESLCARIRATGIPYGFGGIASLGKGELQAEYVIAEHYRLGSQYAILSRSFCNANLISDLEIIRSTFGEGVKKIRQYEAVCANADENFFEANKKKVAVRVTDVVNRLS